MPFVCGVVEHRVRSTRDKGYWSWPFGRADLGETGLLAYAPVFFGRLAVDIAYGEIAAAFLKPNRIGGRVRLQRTAPRSGHVSLFTIGDSYLRIADRLREQGVKVAGSTSRSGDRKAKAP